MIPGDRILVVEDDDDIREVVEEILSSEGYRVEVAKDGIDALGKLDGDTRPLLILLDMMMPRMDGETFLRALAEARLFADAPVVVISGNAAAREKAHALHAAACLVEAVRSSTTC